MSGSYVANAGSFLLDVAFGLYIGAVMLRLFLQWTRADFYNPLSQAIVRLTNPVLRPLRRYVPAVGRIDTASILAIFSLQLLNLWLKLMLADIDGSAAGLVVLALAEILAKACYLFTFAILLQVIASWIAPGAYNPALALVDALTWPLMKPLRGLVPTLGGLDLTPMVALVLLQLSQMLVVAPIRDLAVSLF
jgi:YggT family protein